MFKYITSKPLWFNILVGIGIILVLVLGFFLSLDWITGHGQYEKVPSVTGLNYQEAIVELKQKGFSVEISDSVYDVNVPKLSVVKQLPEASIEVKQGRTIYLTVNRAVAPLIDMPNLVGFSIKSAQMYLNTLGLKMGDTTYKPDIARNAVLSQLYNGAEIKPLTKVPMGSVISFVLGSGLGDSAMEVPMVIGLTFSAAKALLASKNINLANPILMDSNIKDSSAAFIVKQNPEAFIEKAPGQKVPNQIKAGQIMDVWLSTTPPPPPTDSSINPLPQQ